MSLKFQFAVLSAVIALLLFKTYGEYELEYSFNKCTISSWFIFYFQILNSYLTNNCKYVYMIACDRYYSQNGKTANWLHNFDSVWHCLLAFSIKYGIILSVGLTKEFNLAFLWKDFLGFELDKNVLGFVPNCVQKCSVCINGGFVLNIWDNQGSSQETFISLNVLWFL